MNSQLYTRPADTAKEVRGGDKNHRGGHHDITEKLWTAVNQLQSKVSRIEHRLKDLEHAPVTADWRPISEAPRDGRWVWGWDSATERPIRIQWSSRWIRGGYWRDGNGLALDNRDVPWFFCDALPAGYTAPPTVEAQP